MALTKEDRIKTVYGGGGHIVILGAGASIASTRRNAEKYGKTLPCMDNFIEVIGLQDILDLIPDDLRASNFEKLYSNLHRNDPSSDIIRIIEDRVYEYFSDMELPDEPTIYDYLLLSLRSRDIIVTFNWDPFLYQAFYRNRHVGEMPYLSFLHGNVAIGYSTEDKRTGAAGMFSKQTMNYYEPTKLLYPVEQKNYNNDECIQLQWEWTRHFLRAESTKLVTIFGYGAPATDVEAVNLLHEAWGGKDKRNMEQFEIIDIRPEDEVREQWDTFIHTHHYWYSTDFFNCSLTRNPRRTSESYFQHIMPSTPDEAFSENNPVPSNFRTLEELWDWFKPLIEAEEEWKRGNKKQG